MTTRRQRVATPTVSARCAYRSNPATRDPASAPAIEQADLGRSLHSLHRRQGLVPEAAAVFLAWLFDMRGLHRVTASGCADNIASRMVMQRLGMRRESHTRLSRMRRGVWHDEVGYALLRREWSAHR